jgi:hypothetical protein
MLCNPECLSRIRIFFFPDPGVKKAPNPGFQDPDSETSFDADLNLDPTFHFVCDPDPDPIPSFTLGLENQKLTFLRSSASLHCFYLSH